MRKFLVTKRAAKFECELACQEVKPEARKQTLEDFAISGRSVLYQSLLPVLGSGAPFDLNIEVESPAITLNRPKNVAAKRQQVAERRIAEEKLAR